MERTPVLRIMFKSGKEIVIRGKHVEEPAKLLIESFFENKNKVGFRYWYVVTDKDIRFGIVPKEVTCISLDYEI